MLFFVVVLVAFVAGHVVFVGLIVAVVVSDAAILEVVDGGCMEIGSLAECLLAEFPAIKKKYY